MPLFYKKNGKSYKNYEIAHIYPLNPTPAEMKLLQHEERLSQDVNDENNLIPLCSTCHTKFDKPRTVEEYRKLVAIKKRLSQASCQAELWRDYKIEAEIKSIIEAIYAETDECGDVEITFIPKRVDEKINGTMTRPTKQKIKNNVRDYYTKIRETFALLDKSGDGISDIISSQIKTFYLAQRRSSVSQQVAFENIVNWLDAKTKPATRDAAEIIASFFVQNCEIFE